MKIINLEISEIHEGMLDDYNNVELEKEDIKLTLVFDKSVSYKAKGIMLRLYAHAKNGEGILHQKDLTESGKDGLESIRTGMKELEEAGYIEKSKVICKGFFVCHQYKLLEGVAHNG